MSIIKELKDSLLGWKAYFDISEVLSTLIDIDKWIRRKLRCYLWKQWGRAGYRRLRKLGVDRFLAWNTAKSAHGPWRFTKLCQIDTLGTWGCQTWQQGIFEFLNRLGTWSVCWVVWEEEYRDVPPYPD
jgi:hypothetical protein